MSFLAGAGISLAGILGAGLITDLVNNAFGFGANKHFQEDSQRYNSEQAEIDRNFQHIEAKLARDWQTSANQIAMDFNHREAEIQRAYELSLSNTEVQRRMADLKKAGINPILAASIGGSATPTGASASVGTSGTTSARGNSASSGANNFKAYSNNLVSSVTDVLNTAKKIEKVSDEIQHSKALREIYQSREKRDSIRFEKWEKSSARAEAKERHWDDFFEASARRTFEDM